MINKAKAEILAPAGAMEQLTASVRAGADAVYLGAGKFNARQAAANFDEELLREAVLYCHERGVRVYLAMNTLLFDEEFGDAARLVQLACALPVDAIIVQDAGLAAYIRRCAPDMPLHASTQMTVHNPSALDTLRDMGFVRAILAREMSREEMAQMSAHSDMELEAFVHGALCMSVSGQCYLSAMLGSRSGNRGRCAQPCRLPFCSGDFENCLSLRDMSLIGHIDDMIGCGITSLKIEGRLKRPEYCAAATAACRQARDDGRVDGQLSESLGAVFSRSGFTDGYFTARRGRTMFGSRTKDDVTAASSSLLASLHELYKNEYQRIPLRMSFSASAGRPAQLSVSDGSGCCTVSGPIPQPAAGRPLDSESVSARLAKTGGTACFAESIECEIGEQLSLPASAINAMRREALEQLSRQRRSQPAVEFDASRDDCDFSPHRPPHQEYHAAFRSVNQLPEKLPTEITRIYLPLETPIDELTAVREKHAGAELCVEAPRGLFGNEDKIRRLLSDSSAAGIKRCMIHNIGLIGPVRDAGMLPVGGFGLNITNTRSLESFRELGLSSAELSQEMTAAQIGGLSGQLERGITIYGHQPLMLVRNCPAALGRSCPGGHQNGGFCTITDRKNMTFPVMCRMGCSEVFNSIPLSITEKTAQFGSVDWFLIRFSVENPVETEEILEKCVRGNPICNERITRGLFYRGVE